MTGAPSQTVRFCTAPDGVQIAYAVHGSGPPLLVSTCSLSHLQHDWESPVWRHFLDDLGRIVLADHPAVLVGQDQGPTPAELLINALASCLMAGLANIGAALVAQSVQRSAVYDVITHGTAVAIDVC